MRSHEITRTGAELIDQKCAAGPDRLCCFLGDHGAKIIGKRRKWQARKNIVGMCKPETVNDCVHIRCRTMDSDEAAIANSLTQICNKIFVKINDQQRRVGAHAVQNGLTECTDARAIFHEQFGVVPVNRRKHFFHGEG